MEQAEWTRDEFSITTAADRIDVEFLERMLRTSYWASDRTRAEIDSTIEHSVCFSLFRASRQIGFARVLSDFAQLAWIGDVIIDPEFRGRGLGRWLMECVLEHPSCTTPRIQILRTRDAHGLYEPLGFERREYLVRGFAGDGGPLGD